MDATPSRLNSAHRTLVIDASVLINLLGTRCPGAILETLQRVFLIDEITLSEVTVDPATRRSAKEVLEKLLDDGLITSVGLDAVAYEMFVGFTGAPSPDDLDDGEAATLAHAAQSRFAAVIDERKARRIAQTRKPPIEVLTSLDLIAAPELIGEWEHDRLSEALYLSLRDAKMRIHWEHKEWISQFIGEDRAEHCPVLNRARPGISIS